MYKRQIQAVNGVLFIQRPAHKGHLFIVMIRMGGLEISGIQLVAGLCRDLLGFDRDRSITVEISAVGVIGHGVPVSYTHLDVYKRQEQDEDGEETGEDVTRDDSWNYAEILWNGIQAKAVTASFEQLSYKEQWYLEKRNAICLTCGRVSPLSTQSTFEDLAVDFEGTTASGAERFYRRTLDKLRLKLLESGVIHTVTLKRCV